MGFNQGFGGGGEGAGGTVTGVTGTAPITSSGGAAPDIAIDPATALLPGSMSAADKAKLDAITTVVTSVGATAPITSSGGVTPSIGIGAASGVAAGSMSAADFTKLAGIGAGASVISVSNSSPATLGGTPNQPIIGVQTFGPAQAGAVPLSGGGTVNFLRADGTWATPAGTGVTSVGGTAPIVSSGGATPAISITPATGAAAGSMSAADKTKLDTVTAGAAVASVGGTAPIVSSGGLTPAISITAATGAAAGSMSAADKAKLDGITTPVVSTTRTISTTAPLTGGGDLSANRTLAVNTFGAAQPGVVPLSGGGTANFLRADGTWAAPPAGASVFRQSVFAEVVADSTTGSGAYIDLLTASITVTAGAILLIYVSASSSNSNGILIPGENRFRVTIDGVAQRGSGAAAYNTAEFGTAIVLRVPVAAGVRSVKLQWSSGGGTVRVRPVASAEEHASLLVCEVGA